MSPNASIPNASLPSARILVVDDTPANLKVIIESLSVENYTISTAISGERALKRLENCLENPSENSLPDLILLDIQMPGIDGFETCRQIKSNPATANIPIIFITAFSETERIVKGFSLGAVDYICKPIREPELLARVRTHLQVQQFTRQLENQVAERTSQWKAAAEEVQRSKLQIVQNEKMSALGNLVAGVAHEINNPIGFLNGSVSNAQGYLKDLMGLIEVYREEYPQVNESIQTYEEDIDIDFLVADFPKLLGTMTAATQRIKSISNSLRIFSRADKEHKVSTDLHEGLDSTLLILKYRLKGNERRPAIEVVKDYSDLPNISCFPGQLNQVFMNLLANAIDIFDEAAERSSFAELEETPQVITVKTEIRPEDKTVMIRIRDNGKGMSEEVKVRVFDHLFTTKGVGKGTGLGLAIARQIVSEKHEGSLTVQSELGQGTEFCIQLPL
ncbi:MAG: response regulator [Cyanobacteria bacterium J06634_5]